MKEAEVAIPSKLHNSLIGSKGCLVRSIMEDCGGVHIHFPSEGSGSDKVTIRGPVEEVEKAKKQLLQLAEEKVGGAEKRWSNYRGGKYLLAFLVLCPSFLPFSASQQLHSGAPGQTRVS